MTMGPQFESAFPDSSAVEKAHRMGLDPSKGTHGTTMKAETPKAILPAREAGVGPHYSLSNPDKAYYNAAAGTGWKGAPAPHMSWQPDDPGKYASHQGWKWAHEAVGHAPVVMTGGPGTGKPLRESPRKRAVVHHVQPSGTVSADENLPHTSAMTADRLKVVDTEWIPPSRFEKEAPTSGMQGTLPNVNWNQFGGDHARHIEQNWHEYGSNPAETGEQRVLRRMVADGRLPADSPHNPDFDAIRNRNVRKPEVPGQMEMVDRPATWHSEARKADV